MDSKNVLKTVIFSLQVDFTGHFVHDCQFKLYFWQLKFSVFSPPLPDFVMFFYVVG